MRIAVIGAATDAGKMIVSEAEKKGIQVVSVVEDPSVMPGSGPVVIKDFRTLERGDLDGVHAVVDAVSFPGISRYSSDDLPLWHLGSILSGTDSSMLVLGATSCLYSDSSRKSLVLDDCCYTQIDNEQTLRLCATAVKRLRAEHTFKWTLLCPPLVLDTVGYATGKFVFGDDVLPMSIDGSSYICLADFAKASVDLLIRGLKPSIVISVRSE